MKGAGTGRVPRSKKNLETLLTQNKFFFIAQGMIHGLARLLRWKTKPAALLRKHSVQSVVSGMKAYIGPRAASRAVLRDFVCAKDVIEMRVRMNNMLHLARFLFEYGNDAVRISARIHNDCVSAGGIPDDGAVAPEGSNCHGCDLKAHCKRKK